MEMGRRAPSHQSLEETPGKLEEVTDVIKSGNIRKKEDNWKSQESKDITAEN